MSGDIEGNEGQDDDESYNAHLQQEDVVDDTDTTEGDLLATSNDGDVIIATSEIVEEQVMENNDPPVIVQSLVNVEFVDDKYKNYCGDPLGHSIEDSNSPTNMRGTYTSYSKKEVFFTRFYNIYIFFFFHCSSQHSLDFGILENGFSVKGQANFPPGRAKADAS